MKKSAVIAIVCLGLANLAGAAGIFGAGGLYTENFDSIGSLGTTPPPNWTSGNYNPYLNRQLLDSSPSAVNNDALFVDDGSDGTKGRSYNYGTTGAADRAIGHIPTTSYGDGGLQVAIENNTGVPITTFDIQYTGEQWRDYQGTASTKPERLRVYISNANNGGYIYLPNLDFNAPQDNGLNAALDGNAAANRTVLSDTVSLAGIGYPGGAIAPGASFYLTWHDWNDNAANDHALAVDDVSVVVPEPSSILLAVLGLIGLLGYAWRRRRA